MLYPGKPVHVTKEISAHRDNRGYNMKACRIIIVLGAMMCFGITCGAQDTGPCKSTDVLIERFTRAYRSEDTAALMQYIWYNSPKGSKVMQRSQEEFARYDSITFELRPVSTVFYKRMGYENVEVRFIEDFRGVDVSTKSFDESSCMSVFSMFKDFDGAFYILNWERKGTIPMIKIQKTTSPSTPGN